MTHLEESWLPKHADICAGAMDQQLRYKFWKYHFWALQLFRGIRWTTRMTMCGLGYYAHVAKLSIYC